MGAAQKERQTTQLVNLSEIVTNAGTLARESVDPDFVDSYCQAFKDKEPMPAVVLFYDGERFFCGDGHHRVAAAIKADMAMIDAVVKDGTARDAILFAMGCNDTHGRRRSNADKRLCVETLLADDEWGKLSDRAIARHVRVSHTFVSGVRESLERVATLPVEDPLPRKRLKHEREERDEPADDWSPAERADEREPEAEAEPVRRPAKVEPKTPLCDALDSIAELAREVLAAVPVEELHLAADQFKAMGEWLVEKQANGGAA